MKPHSPRVSVVTENQDVMEKLNMQGIELLQKKKNSQISIQTQRQNYLNSLDMIFFYQISCISEECQ
jgi:hypothetical protein